MVEPPQPPPLDIERCAKLLALLASDVDGEVLAAARALSRLLRASGSDLVALAELLAQLARSSRPPRHYHAGRSSGLRKRYHGR
jgi:hypothetical protein